MSKLSFKEMSTKVNFKTLSQELNDTFQKHFPKEKREELKDKVLNNLKETRQGVENRARILAEKTKDSPIILNYLRPLVGNEKTGEVLANLESRSSRVAPVFRRIQALRQQFLDATAPTPESQAEEKSDEKSSSTKKRKPRSSAQKSSD